MSAKNLKTTTFADSIVHVALVAADDIAVFTHHIAW